MPAAAVSAAVTGGGEAIVLPQVIVDAGPAAVGRFLEFFAGRITAYLSNGRTLEHAQQIAVATAVPASCAQRGGRGGDVRFPPSGRLLPARPLGHAPSCHRPRVADGPADRSPGVAAATHPAGRVGVRSPSPRGGSIDES